MYLLGKTGCKLKCEIFTTVQYFSCKGVENIRRLYVLFIHSFEKASYASIRKRLEILAERIFNIGREVFSINYIV